MSNNGVQIKGIKDGLEIIFNDEKYSYDKLVVELIDKMKGNLRFFRGSSIKLVIDFDKIDKDILADVKKFFEDDIEVKNLILEDKNNYYSENSTFFSGIDEGKTKFIYKTVRSGQKIFFNGNIVVIGDINSGAEVIATGNVVVLGELKGRVQAGFNGNDQTIIAAFRLSPEILQISDTVVTSPEGDKPKYPEVARLKNGCIEVEPYSINKYVY